MFVGSQSKITNSTLAIHALYTPNECTQHIEWIYARLRGCSNNQIDFASHSWKYYLKLGNVWRRKELIGLPGQIKIKPYDFCKFLSSSFREKKGRRRRKVSSSALISVSLQMHHILGATSWMIILQISSNGRADRWEDLSAEPRKLIHLRLAFPPHLSIWLISISFDQIPSKWAFSDTLPLRVFSGRYCENMIGEDVRDAKN